MNFITPTSVSAMAPAAGMINHNLVYRLMAVCYG